MNNVSILHLIFSLDVGGLEILLKNIAALQLKKGYQVSIGCMGGYRGVMAEELEAQGVRVFTGARHKHWYDCPRYALKAATIIRASKANVLHCHIDSTGALIPIVISRLLGIRVMVRSIHNSFPGQEWGAIKRIWRKLEISICVLLGTRLAAVSSDVRENEVNVFKIPRRWIEVVPNGINIAAFEASEGANIPVQSLIGKDIPRGQVYLLCCVARFFEQKNHQMLIRAMAELRQRNLRREPHLLLVGEGPLENQCRTLTKELALENNIHFLGLCRDIPKLLSQIDLFVISSRYEGVGLVAIEAMASRKPVIATNVQGLRQVVVDGETGILVDKDGPEKFADAIELLLNSPPLCQKMGQHGYERAKKLYSLESCLEKYEKLYGLIV